MKDKNTKITDLAVLPVFAVFAVCVLTVLLYGARVYSLLTQQGEESFRMRTLTQYVTTRVRQAETVSVTDFAGCEALALTEQSDGTTYVTYVYCYEGFLRELFCAEGASLLPADGEKLLPAERLQLSVEGDLLTAVVDGFTVNLQLRGKGEAEP